MNFGRNLLNFNGAIFSANRGLQSYTTDLLGLGGISV